MSYTIIDIETVPDYAVWQPKEKAPERLKVEKKPGKADMDFLSLVIETIGDNKRIHPSDLEKAHDIALRAENKEGVDLILGAGFNPDAEEDKDFPPLHAHRIVAVGFVQLSKSLTYESHGCVSNDDERSLLEQLSSYLAAVRPTIVTWNGRSFDLPVINVRSLRRAVQQRWYNDQVRNRYKEDAHLDLMDILSDFNPQARLKLDAVARSIGLAGKWGDMDGSKVEETYNAGNIEKICTYCTSDVVQTAFVLMRMFLVRARINVDEYRQAANSLFDIVKADPKMAEFVAACDPVTLLLE